MVWFISVWWSLHDCRGYHSSLIIPCVIVLFVILRSGSPRWVSVSGRGSQGGCHGRERPGCLQDPAVAPLHQGQRQGLLGRWSWEHQPHHSMRHGMLEFCLGRICGAKMWEGFHPSWNPLIFVGFVVSLCLPSALHFLRWKHHWWPYHLALNAMDIHGHQVLRFHCSCPLNFGLMLMAKGKSYTIRIDKEPYLLTSG